MAEEQFGLPRELGHGLVLRWGEPADLAALAEFNYIMHNDNPGGQPELWLKAWTAELMKGRHPTTTAGDFTVVVQDGEIVSTAVLISQTWSYEGIQFGCGRLELIATDENFRRQGLVRHQMDALHKKSASRGELVQAITGIPWFYRQFGYEMALNLGGYRELSLSTIKKVPLGQDEQYRKRPAQETDWPFLAQLYEQGAEASSVSCVRDRDIWSFELNYENERHINRRNYFVVETFGGDKIGYFEVAGFPDKDNIREIGVIPGVSLRDISLFVARSLKEEWLERQNEPSKPPGALKFRLGSDHPVYGALRPELGQQRPPYAWFIRMSDPVAFLAHIGPVLESRLAESAMAGYSGQLKINLYRSQFKIIFVDGRLITVETYRPGTFFDGDLYLPDLTHVQLFLGYRSLDDLKYAFPDCFTNSEDAEVLSKILFPKKPSHIAALA